MRNICTLLFFSLTFAFRAQEVCSYSVLFSSNQFSLDKTAISRIDSVKNKLSNIPAAYTIKMSGHTDNTGAEKLNSALSLKRAEEVKRYLVSEGFESKSITCNAYADLKPVGDNNIVEGKTKNRRVTISIYTKDFDVSKALNVKSNTESFTVDAATGIKYKYSSGTEVVIPPNAFETIDGKSVSGKVDLYYTEYRNNTDFLFSGIPMSFFDEKEQFRQFNSAGMFKIEAFQNKERLKLKPNETIKVNFVRTQNLPELKFFSFDSVHNKWNETGQKVSSSGIIVFNGHRTFGKDLKPCVETINKKDSCILYPCTGALFAIRKGLEWTSSAIPISVERPQIHFKKIRDPRNNPETFKLKIESFSKKTVVFKIIPDQELSVFDNFREYSWVYHVKKNNPLKKEWENIVWLRVSVSYIKNSDFELTLFSNANKVIFPVKAKVKNNMRALELEQYHLTNRESNLNLVLDQGERQNNFDTYFNNVVFKMDTVEAGIYKSACADSLICFYQYSRQWMDKKTGEDTLPYRKWIDYFNAHKALLKPRYEKLEKETKHLIAGCQAEEKIRKEEEVKNKKLKAVVDSTYGANIGKQTDVLNGMFQELSIKNLGVWNCDQVERLKDPIYVKKTYTDPKGNKVEPILIYVIDKAVSGTLTYNGYRDLSPYYFPVSSKSENTLIAFDVNNKGYVCKASELKTLIQKSDSGPILLTPLEKENSKTQIAVLVN